MLNSKVFTSKVFTIAFTVVFAMTIVFAPIFQSGPMKIEEARAATAGNAHTYYMDSTLSSPNQLRLREYASSSSAWGTESSANQTTNPTINNIVVEASPTRDEKLIGVWSDTATASQSELRVFRWNGATQDETLIFQTTIGADLGAATRPFDIAYEYSSGDALIVYSNGGTTNEISYLTWNGTATSSVSTQELAGTSAAVTNIELTSRATSTSDRIAMIYAVNASTNALNAAVWNGSSWESNPSTPLETGSAFAATTSIALAIDWEDVSGEILAVWDTTAADNVFRYNTCTGGPPCTWGTTANSATAESMTVGALSRRFGTNELFLVVASNNGNDTGAGRWSGSAWTVAQNLDGTNGGPSATLGQQVAAGWLEAGGAVRAIGVYGDAAAAGLDFVQWNGSALSLGTDLCTTGPPATLEKQIVIKQNPFATDWLLVLVKDANADVYGYKVTFNGTNLGCSYLGVLNANVGVNTDRSFDFDFDRFIPPIVANLSQDSYQFFTNADSLTPGSQIAGQNSAATITSTSSPVRLRINLRNDGPGDLPSGLKSFKLQWSISTSSGWTDVGRPPPSDNFNRADENPLANGTWSLVGGFEGTPMKIVSNEAVASAAGGSNGWSVWTASTFGGDVSASVKITGLPSTYAFFEQELANIYLKLSSTSSFSMTGYLATIYQNSANGYGAKILRINGAYDNTTILSSSTISLSAGDEFKFTALNDLNGTLRLYKNNNLVLETTDTTYKAQTGYVGIGATSVSTSSPITPRIDDFKTYPTSTLFGFDNPSVADGASLPSLLLSGSTASETYEESNPTVMNTSAITVGGRGEWDFTLDPVNTANGTTYYFRMVYADGSPLAGYDRYAALTVSSGGAPDTTPPTPNPMTFASPPAAQSVSSISMTATTATDAQSPPVSYFFSYTACLSDNGTGATSSGWQSGTTYVNSGLQVNKCYAYAVKARDSASPPNETGHSSSSTAYTLANIPAAPTVSSPTTSTLAITNNENGNPSNTIFAVVVTSTAPFDPAWNGYYVDSTGASSSFPVFLSDAAITNLVVKNLKPNTTYTFTAKAQNGDGIETGWGPTGQGTTQDVTSFTTTLGNDTSNEPPNQLIAPGAGRVPIDAFSFRTSSSTDAITAVTVTLAANTASGIAKVEITNSTGATVYGSSTNPAADTFTISLSGLSVGTATTSLRIYITPKSHAAMPPPPGQTFSVTARVTDWVGTNAHAGSDTGSATITIDNLSPGNVSSASGSAGDGQVSLSWVNPPDGDFSETIVLRRALLSVLDTPSEGVNYVVGQTIGSSIVACVTSGGSCTDIGLSNNTAYHYKIFAKDAMGNYSAGGIVPSGSPFTPLPPSGGGPARVASGCVSGRCLDFNGTSDYVSIPGLSSAGGTISIEAMFNADRTDGNRGIFSYLGRDSAPFAAAYLKISGGNLVYYLGFSDGTNSGNVSVQSVSSNSWYHFAITYDGSVLRAYVNGVLKRTDIWNKTLSVVDANSFIGRDRPGGSEYFDGKIDIVRIYNRVRSNEEIARHYNDVSSH